MNVLITGASGFVGKHLYEHLQGCSDRIYPLDQRIDIGNPTEVEDGLKQFRDLGVDVVYHLAAFANVVESFQSSTEVYRVNVLGTANVLSSTRRYFSQAKVIVVSSSEVYGIVDPTSLPVDESHVVAPLSPYAASKAAAEQIALQSNRAYGQDVVVARPFNHFGPGQDDSYVVSALAKRILLAQKNKFGKVEVGNLNSERDFTDVRDVVKAYRRLAEDGVPGEIYNVCSGASISIRRIADILIQLVSGEINLEVNQSLVRGVEVSKVRGSNVKISNALQWEPEIPIERSLKDVLQWWSTRL